MRPYHVDFARTQSRRTRATAMARPVAWHRPAAPPCDGDWLGALAALLTTWRERRRGRAALARLDLRMLRDIGVTQDAADREYNKPFWRP
jgi:uncharacterized protein YjiS (DUF1127 family)